MRTVLGTDVYSMMYSVTAPPSSIFDSLIHDDVGASDMNQGI